MLTGNALWVPLALLSLIIAAAVYFRRIES